MNILKKHHLSRRTILQGAGVSLSLPWLNIMGTQANAAATGSAFPKRSVFTMWGLGINGRDFTPRSYGKDYEMTPILKPLEKHREDFTVVSGLKLTHSGGHSGDRTFLTGTNTHKSGAKLRISADQELAEAVGRETRFRSLSLGIRRGTGFGNPQDNTLSWSKSGTPIPAENRPHILFDKLFRPDTPESLAQREAEFARRTSILDSVREEAKRLENSLGKVDQEKLDEYLTGIRDLEASMQEEKDWLYKPKPKVEGIDFGDEQGLDPERGKLDYSRYQRRMFDVITLALQTDSTRVIAYQPRMDNSDGTGAFKSKGNPYGYHTMTHHGEDADKLKWWTFSDVLYMEEWAYFLNKLKNVQEGEGTLLDNTMAVYSSTGGTINAHNNHHLPAILCGGKGLGVQHQGHIQQEDAYLGNLWQTMFGFMGVEIPDNFQGGEADGVIKGLV